MHALVQTIAFRGIDNIPIDVQVYIANGLPTIAIVCLADKAVAELRERVQAALSSIGLALPPKRKVVNITGRCGERRRAFRFTHRAWLVDGDGGCVTGCHCRS